MRWWYKLTNLLSPSISSIAHSSFRPSSPDQRPQSSDEQPSRGMGTYRSLYRPHQTPARAPSSLLDGRRQECNSSVDEVEKESLTSSLTARRACADVRVCRSASRIDLLNYSKAEAALRERGENVYPPHREPTKPSRMSTLSPHRRGSSREEEMSSTRLSKHFKF